VPAPRHRHPRAEAQAALGDDDRHACVLEPSPPAVAVEPYADDPATPDPARPSVTPTTAGAVTWDELAHERSDLASFCADHWLGTWRRLPALPSDFARSLLGLHRIAFYVMSAARRAVTGRIGLRWTAGGFGTPFFADDMQVRVEGEHLVVQSARSVRVDELTTLRRAGSLLGMQPRASDRGEFDVPELGDVDEPLRIDRASVAFLDGWYGLGASLLEQVRVDAADHGPSLVQLWPEHFDLAVEAGIEAVGARAGYGCSPGDAAHAEPYLYVAPWQPVDRSEPFWNDHAFNGASLSLASLVDAEDQRAAALTFFRKGLALTSPTRP
jgi:hypothetical protein